MSVQVTGLQENIDALNGLSEALQNEMPDMLDIAAEPMFTALGDYPEQRPGSKYERKYDLLDSTYSVSENEGATASWTAGQTDEAAHWVGHIDDDYQAWMHKGIWETAAAIKARLIDPVMSTLDGLISDLISRFMGR